jgi:hypothetical protein
MAITRDEAVEQLRAVEETHQRSATAYGYEAAAPHLIIWGVVWALGYTISDLLPAASGQAWFGLSLVGVLADFVLSRTRLGCDALGPNRWRFAAGWLAIGGFFGALFTVLGPVSTHQVGAVIPLFVALAYVLLGLWRGVRFLIAGLLIAVLTLIGYFYVPAHFDLWMAIVGGGALIIAGLWLRRI